MKAAIQYSVNVLWAIALSVYDVFTVNLLWGWIVIPLGGMTLTDFDLLAMFVGFLLFHTGIFLPDTKKMKRILHLPMFSLVLDTLFIGIGWLIHMALV